MAIAELPEDLVKDILLRLPVKSLVRFKSVCKTWCSLFQNPSFVSLHHNRTAENTMEFIDIDMSFTGLDIKAFQLLGSCNGVVCLVRPRIISTIVICNPSIREFRILPQPSHETNYMPILGLGFDPYNNDYKVVKFRFREPYAVPLDIGATAQIYDLSRDSWREVDVKCNTELRLNFRHSLSASWKGDFYWYVFGYKSPDALIVFRMTEEVLDEIPLPEVCFATLTGNAHLFAMNDSLALVLKRLPSADPLRVADWDWVEMECFDFDIWVMDELGVEVYWTKKFTIRPALGFIFPLGFRRNGEFLWKNCGGQIWAYHIKTRQTKMYQVHVHPPPGFSQVLLYSESMVSVKRQN